jgi:hypothetical protein
VKTIRSCNSVHQHVSIIQELNEETAGVIKRHKGFKKLLMGIFIHSGKYTTAAPMAHYLANYNSRFRYSQEQQNLPIQMLSDRLLGRPVQMRITKSKNTTQAFCSAMNYLLRPSSMESMCPYTFCEQTMNVDIRRARSAGQTIHLYQPQHPFVAKDGVIRITQYRIPVFPYSWLGDTKQLRQNLLDPRNHGKPEGSREESARKFMLLFAHYREDTDIQKNGSYIDKLRQLESDGKTQQIEHIANNIQAIRNSLDAGRVEDFTRPLQAAEEVMEKEDDLEEDDDISARNTIAEFLLTSSSNKTEMKHEATSFIRKIPAIWNPNHVRDQSIFSTDNVIEYASDDAISGQAAPTPDVSTRYVTSTDCINTLILTESALQNNGRDYEGFPIPSQDQNRAKTRPNANGTFESIVLWGHANMLDDPQQVAFEIMVSTYILSFIDEASNDLSIEASSLFEDNVSQLRLMARETTRNGAPLRCFVTGPAGAGKCKSITPTQSHITTFSHMDTKATILVAVSSYAKNFSSNIGHLYTERSILKTALTGTAATEIKGCTVHSACHINAKIDNIGLDKSRQWDDVRLLIVDEISFGGRNRFLPKLSSRLQKLSQTDNDDSGNCIYGKVNIVFMGDFLQLEPIGDLSIYSGQATRLWDFAINTLVELNGKHRFRQCRQMGDALAELRETGMTERLRDLFNTRVVDGINVKLPDLSTTQFATARNAKRTDINYALFHEYLEKNHRSATKSSIPSSAMIVKAGAWWSSDVPLTFTQRKQLYEECTEADIKDGRDKHCDPFLRLWKDCKVMCLQNVDVSRGIANGTCAKFESIVLKPRAMPQPIKYNGFWINCVCAEEVDYIILRWEDQGNWKGTFRISPNRKPYKTTWKTTEDGQQLIFADQAIKLLQLECTLNHATTGHKLQGKSLDKLIIAEWNNDKNWIYVVLSRVKTLDGLFLLKPLPELTDTAPHEDYKRMMEFLRSGINTKETDQAIIDIKKEIEQRKMQDVRVTDKATR